MGQGARPLRVPDTAFGLSLAEPGVASVWPRPNLEESLAVGTTALLQAANAILPRRPRNLLHKKAQESETRMLAFLLAQRGLY